MLDGTDKCGTVCHGMSKSLLLMVSTEIMKIKIFYLENMGAERFERDWDWCYVTWVQSAERFERDWDWCYARG